MQVPGGVSGAPVRVGFVVSRAVGGSVVRHRVTRRLRAIVVARLDELSAPSGGSQTLLVVRALPSSAHASSSELAHDLDAALAAARRRSPAGPGARTTGGPSR
jgi:ribonuclease P protein component